MAETNAMKDAYPERFCLAASSLYPCILDPAHLYYTLFMVSHNV